MESDETFFVNLSSPVNATIADGQGVGTIFNDDVAPVPGISVADSMVLEGDSGTTTAAFTVTGSTVYSPQAEQLTQTLRSANGPPASSVESELVATSSTVTSFESDCSSCTRFHLYDTRSFKRQ